MLVVNFLSRMMLVVNLMVVPPSNLLAESDRKKEHGHLLRRESKTVWTMSRKEIQKFLSVRGFFCIKIISK